MLCCESSAKLLSGSWKLHVFPTSLCGVLFLVVHFRLPASCPRPARVLPASCPRPARVLPASCPRPARVLPASCPLPPPHTHNTQLVTNLLTHNLTTHNLSTHNLLTHTQLAHTQLAHIQIVTTQLAHLQLVTTQLTHTQLVHTQLAHTQLAHTHTTWPHTTCHHTTCSHTTYSHTTSPHTTCPNTTCSHTHNLLTHNLPTYNLSPHNLLTHNLLTHNLLTHNFSTHNLSPHNLSTHNLLTHNLPTCNTTCPHITCSHTNCSHTRGHLPSLCVAGVALMALLWLRWRAWFPFGAVGAAAVCVAGVALGDMDRQFALQAWHLATSIVTLRGRRGTYGTGLALVARLVPVWRRGRRRCLRGRRGTWRHGPSLCVAHVALGDIDRHFAWQAWHLLWHWAGSGRLVPVWRRGRRRGRRGTYGTGLAPVARLVPCRRRGRSGFAWQAWHLAAGVALGDIDRHFAWQAWHLWHWAGSGGALGSRLAPCAPPLFAWQAWHLATWTVTLRGTRGTWRHRPSLCVAGVALTALRWVWALGSPWQEWHLWHWASSGGTLGSLSAPRAQRLFAWQAWHLATSTVSLRCRRGTWRHRSSLCGQAWHFWHWTGYVALVARLVPVWRRGRQAWHLATWTVTYIHAASEPISFKFDFVTHTHTTLSRAIFHISLSHAALSRATLSNTTLSHTTFSRTSLSHTQLCHSQLCHAHNFVTHNFVTHTQLCHTQSLSHRTLSHTTLSPTTLSHTHNFVTHTTLSRRTVYIQLCHRQYFTHNFVTHTHNLSHTALLREEDNASARMLHFVTLYIVHPADCNALSCLCQDGEWVASEGVYSPQTRSVDSPSFAALPTFWKPSGMNGEQPFRIAVIHRSGVRRWCGPKQMVWMPARRWRW